MKPKSLSVTTSELVILAIHDLEEKNPENHGFTQADVAKFIADNYHIDAKSIKQSVHETLLRGARFGVFSQNTGRYKLESLPEVPSKAPDAIKDKEKLGALIVEVSSETVRRKRKKQSEDDVRHWTFDGEDGWESYQYQVAKRRKGCRDEENKSDDEDANLVDFSRRFI